MVIFYYFWEINGLLINLKLYDMKKLLLLSATLLFVLIANAQIVNIPDANFKAVLVADASINTNMDTEIQVSEAAAYTDPIYVANQSITDMTGLEAFINIPAFNCGNNNISVLDISSNTNLSTLHCDNCGLSVLDLTNSPMYFLTCSNNNISSLYLDDSDYLNTLYCDHNQLTSLNLDNCTQNLVTLVCSDNFLTELSIKNGNNINILNSGFYAINNPNLTCIEVDDSIWSATNWTNIDPASSFSTNCSGGSAVFISQAIITNVLCNGDCNGDISITVSGGTPGYTYSWIGPSGYTNTNEDISGLCAGTYDLTVTDGISTTSTASFNITEPAPITIITDSIINVTNGVCNGSIETTTTGGTPNYTYLWNTSNINDDIYDLCPETYILTVTDNNNCTTIDSFVVGSSYDSSYYFVDTLYIIIDTCIFNNTLPVDSALIYNYVTISVDSIVLNWIFWQDGDSILLDVGANIVTPGSNLVYLEVDCGTKAQYVYRFYGLVDVITNIKHNTLEALNINVFPNPTTGKISVEAEGIESIEIFDITGKHLTGFENLSGLKELDLSHEPKGMYIIKVTTSKGVAVEKVILE